jgi:hypothetical protein
MIQVVSQAGWAMSKDGMGQSFLNPASEGGDGGMVRLAK